MDEGKALLSYCLTGNFLSAIMLLLALGLGGQSEKLAVTGLLIYTWFITFMTPLLILLAIMSAPREALQLGWSQVESVNKFRKSLWINLTFLAVYFLAFLLCQPIFSWPANLLQFILN
jgi:hypothetical protein